MKRLYRARERKGYQEIIGTEDPVLDYLSFGKLQLEKGEKYREKTHGYEVALVILSGKISISSQGKEWRRVGSRNSVFEGKATTIYIPCSSEYDLTAESAAEVAVCKAKADKKFEPFIILPEEVVVNRRGRDTWQREVHDIIVENGRNRVHRIVVGETFNHPGHWSSFPPHKHDGEHAPEEPDLEEVYHYQLSPRQGFGVQLHYTKDLCIDDAYIVRHGDSFAIDRGYHPVSAGGGYQLYYLWFLAGKSGRLLNPFDDPDHRWLKNESKKEMGAFL
ncbi:5-deoxy-glucuronate isomerase [Melghirimyces profundicolus]|uniref:5-deoxy-glucuronate isomerase n=1 Tax=Melghirimyces profundicolus TaxID=1242148 RepID=UPI001FE7D75D|nr:5-deoxy-glucuronate isomerase [Melghirimyces profundicolus]